MSWRGCESVSVQQLTVQVPPCLLCKRSKKPSPPPERIRPLPGNHCGVGRARDPGERLLKSESDRHISQCSVSLSISHISAIITLCYWFCLGFFFNHSCRGRTDYFIHFGFLQWRRCLHRDYRITSFVSERARGEAVRND